MRQKLRTVTILVLYSILAVSFVLPTPFEDWTLNEAIQVLNNSSWARQETYTRVIGGIGSGIQGEKEIYNTFFVRFLSAPPIRAAYARIQKLSPGNSQLTDEQRRDVESRIQRGLEIDLSDWIVVAVTFRSNNARQQSSVESYFQRQTIETIKNRAYLSTKRFPKLQIHAYYPPRDMSVGAKFVFPRRVLGKAVVEGSDETVVFELEVPGADPLLRATFRVADMIVDGELVI